MFLPSYHPKLAQTPFLLGRHGQSDGNAGELSQGRGEDRPGQPNGLTSDGVVQIESIVPISKAIGAVVRYVSSSPLTRAIESAVTFVNASPDPKPILVGQVAPGEEHGLKEVSQKGWEYKYRREQTKQLREAKLACFMGTLALTEQLHQTDIDNYAEWVMRLGAEGDDSGESPLGASLRGIIALESHGARPGELIFSHGMLNRYMDAIATTVDWQDRKRLQQLLEDPAIPELARNVAAIQALKELGVKDFETYDKNNYQANGGFIEYTVDSGPGLWIPGRRIEPQKPGTNPAYIELHHNAETSRWEQ